MYSIKSRNYLKEVGIYLALWWWWSRKNAPVTSAEIAVSGQLWAPIMQGRNALYLLY
jgi:hypothetical protein